MVTLHFKASFVTL